MVQCAEELAHWHEDKLHGKVPKLHWREDKLHGNVDEVHWHEDKLHWNVDEVHWHQEKLHWNVDEVHWHQEKLHGKVLKVHWHQEKLHGSLPSSPGQLPELQGPEDLVPAPETAREGRRLTEAPRGDNCEPSQGAPPAIGLRTSPPPRPRQREAQSEPFAARASPRARDRWPTVTPLV